jgi:PAS domain S-box-containing protein
VFENSQEGIIVLDSSLTIRDLNPAAEWMLGYANWEAQGQAVDNILIGPERLIPALEAACRGIPTHNIGSVNLHRRNGQSFPAHLQTIPVMKDGNLLAIIVFLADVSVHEQIRQRTQQLEHRAILGDVTAVFAHEVRNPINNISTGVQLITSRMSAEDPNLDVLNRIDADCTRLNHLMESVLAFSRPMEHKFEPVDLGILLQRLLDRWRPRLTRVSVELFFQVADNTPKISGDQRALEQVFTNLIGNAVEAMSKTGGLLAVRLAPVDTEGALPQVQVSISDNGPGIPDEIRERIFEPFVTNKPHGTGLGLAITKRIITAHHGNIKLDTFPGGTVFHVFMPAYQGE